MCHCPLRPAAFSLSLYQHSGGAEKALVPRPNPAHVYGKTPSTPACQNHRILEKKRPAASKFATFVSSGPCLDILEP